MRAFLPLLLLAGCAGQPQQRVILRPCSPMPVVPYSAVQQGEMADELERLRTDHPLRSAMEELRQWRIAGRLLTICWQGESTDGR